MRHKLGKYMDEESNVAVDTGTDEEVVLDETTDIEDVDAIKQKVAEAEEAKRQLTARAHKAEAELKALKAKQAEASQNINTNTLDADTVDVKILQSQGVSDELIDQLKKLAKVNGTSILAAQSDPIFQMIKEKKDADDKKAKASLGASRGSGSPTVKKGFTTPDLSKEDHKELWLRSQGR